MPNFTNIITELAVIFGGAAVLATVFIFLKQPILIAYILLGIITGPYCLQLISNSEHIENISHMGIILLLFLIGLNLHPNKLLFLFKKASLITIVSCIIFALIPFVICLLFGIPANESLIIGLALMFSSTVIGLKLTPTVDIHNRRIGELMIGVLLFQDIIAIVLILFLKGDSAVSSLSGIYMLLRLLLNNILLIICSFACVKYIILPLFGKFDVIREYIFIISIGWCLVVAKIAGSLGLSYELGGFIAGVTLAINPISLVISESLKPVREFFLILFFFAIGAQFNPFMIKDILTVSALIALTLLIVKPLILGKCFLISGENKNISEEIGLRLGQGSEFGLIVAYIALLNNRISEQSSYIIQLTVIITFVISTYIVVRKYPTPISPDKKLRIA